MYISFFDQNIEFVGAHSCVLHAVISEISKIENNSEKFSQKN
jgi:hypothetical protein